MHETTPVSRIEFWKSARSHRDTYTHLGKNANMLETAVRCIVGVGGVQYLLDDMR